MDTYTKRIKIEARETKRGENGSLPAWQMPSIMSRKEEEPRSLLFRAPLKAILCTYGQPKLLHLELRLFPI